MSSAQFGLGNRPLLPGTRNLLIAVGVCTVLGGFAGRTLGFGTPELVFDSAAFLRGEIWRVATYPFFQGPDIFGLLLSLLVLWIFGSWFEGRYGTRDFYRFFMLSSIGAALLSIPIGLVTGLVLPFQDTGMAAGPDAALDAILMAFVLNAPNSHVLLGFVLPIQARTIVFVLIGIQIAAGLMIGAAALSVTLGGLTMGYLLVTGNWRPRRGLSTLQRAIRRRKNKRRGLYVVPPKNGTLH